MSSSHRPRIHRSSTQFGPLAPPPGERQRSTAQGTSGSAASRFNKGPIEHMFLLHRRVPGGSMQVIVDFVFGGVPNRFCPPGSPQTLFRPVSLGRCRPPDPSLYFGGFRSQTHPCNGLTSESGMVRYGHRALQRSVILFAVILKHLWTRSLGHVGKHVQNDVLERLKIDLHSGPYP